MRAREHDEDATVNNGFPERPTIHYKTFSAHAHTYLARILSLIESPGVHGASDNSESNFHRKLRRMCVSVCAYDDGWDWSSHIKNLSWANYTRVYGMSTAGGPLIPVCLSVCLTLAIAWPGSFGTCSYQRVRFDVYIMPRVDDLEAKL